MVQITLFEIKKIFYITGTWIAADPFCLFDIKGNLIAVFKGFEALSIDPGMMYEYIGTIFLLDEAIALTGVELFYDAI